MREVEEKLIYGEEDSVVEVEEKEVEIHIVDAEDIRQLRRNVLPMRMPTRNKALFECYFDAILEQLFRNHRGKDLQMTTKLLSRITGYSPRWVHQMIDKKRKNGEIQTIIEGFPKRMRFRNPK